ncbi:hypothetical protein F3Y22_tig00112678pilonHSYRG00014 [Hibiscus syriacus]|uniref:DNA (Cytosine-5)-methyltransferase DRM1/2 n=1 Tax=Hibiscus syriacus TaxID=106335 RepID=A0A6A2WV30_HIBSY|nr:hypothetical protein F3Y22_tig00112678pilonHSYRG00014 [Hibiscus syriacus]
MQHVDSDKYLSDYEAIFQDDFTDIDSSYDTKEILNSDSDEENKLLYLTKIGYSEAEASIVMERCGPDSSIAELTDFICLAQMAKVDDVFLPVEEYDQITQRTVLENAIGPLYFYNENVELALVGVWTEMSRYLYDAEPEFKYVLDDCRKWNLVWVGRNKVAPLEPDEVEMLLGFPKNHTRGGGSARDMFLGSINVISLFSRISDVEVTFYCLGISLKTDVQELNDDWLEKLMSRFHKFDLVGGGIPYRHLHIPLFPNHGKSSREQGLTAGENNLSGDAYRPQHEISDNLS